MAMIPVFRLSRFWSDVREFEATGIAVGGLCHMLRGLPVMKMTIKIPYDCICMFPGLVNFWMNSGSIWSVVAEGYGSTETNLVVTVKEITLQLAFVARPAPILM